MGLPWCSGKESPANSEDTGLICGPGGFHMLRSNQALVLQLQSLCSRAREPQFLSLCAATREATSMRSPHTTRVTSSPQLDRASPSKTGEI